MSGSSIVFRALHHVSVLVADTERALHFYRDVLGLAVESSRPDLGYPGAWLQVGDAQIHLLELPNPDLVNGRPTVPPGVLPRQLLRALLYLLHPCSRPGTPAHPCASHGGRDRHVALTVADLEPLKAALERSGVSYTTSRSGRRALFCRDPDGNAIEFIEQ
jgi:glyoxylase I family protein